MGLSSSKEFFYRRGMKLWENYKNTMEASGFRAMSYPGFTQYVHFFNPDITLTRPRSILQRNWLTASLMKNLTSSQERGRKKKHQGATTNYKNTHKVIADAAKNIQMPDGRPRKAMKVAPNSQSILKFITFKKGDEITPPP